MKFVRYSMEVEPSKVSSIFLLQAIKARIVLGETEYGCLILEPVQLAEKFYRRIGICWIKESLAKAFFENAGESEIFL